MKEHCRETLERAYLYLDKEQLGERERTQIRTHLEECTPCYERYDLEQQVAEIIARLKDNRSCPAGLRKKIKTLLDEA